VIIIAKPITSAPTSAAPLRGVKWTPGANIAATRKTPIPQMTRMTKTPATTDTHARDFEMGPRSVSGRTAMTPGPFAALAASC